MNAAGQPLPPASVLEPSPLLNAELPEWLALHFQTNAKGNWESPQVLAENLSNNLRQAQVQLDLGNVTPRRAELLGALKKHSPAALFDRLPEVGEPPQAVELAQQREQQQF